MKSEQLSYWSVFRPVFVIFSLYLMGDAFSRWDGFRYYASFSEFLPSLGLVSILWSTIAGFLAFLLWLSVRAISLFQTQDKWNITQRVIFALYVFVSLGAVIYFTKQVIWFNAAIPMYIKLILLVGVTLSTVLLTVKTESLQWQNKTKVIQFLYTLFVLTLMIWYSNNISKSLSLTVPLMVLLVLGIILLSLGITWLTHNKINTVQNSITPLVWLFGLFVLLSIPIVGYHTLSTKSNETINPERALSSAPTTKRPNIILVSFDALSAPAMSVYGYDRETTPFISEWAKSATVFTRTQAESTNTYQTTPSMMTGKRIWTHQMYHEHGSAPYEGFGEESMPADLMNSHYYNMAFIANYRASPRKMGLANFFNIEPAYTNFTLPLSIDGARDWGIFNLILFDIFDEKILNYDWIVNVDFILGRFLFLIRPDLYENPFPVKKVFEYFFKEVGDNPVEPFFAWIHLMPPHNPYLAPEPFMGMFDSSQGARSEKKQMVFNSEDLLLLKARYDEFIRYCDAEFGEFIKKLEAIKALEKTIIILSSDHGEIFAHGLNGHGDGHLYEQSTNIPLIIKEPGQTEGRIVNELAEQVDIPATVLDLVNLPVPSYMEGRSLVPLMRGKEIQPRPIFSMNLGKNKSRGNIITKGTIAVWEGDYKLIHYLEEEKSLLFNLKQDPEEMDNLVDREPEIENHLLGLIKTNLEKANERILAENK